MTAVYLAGRALQAGTWHRFVLAPVHDWDAAWHQATAGRVVTAFALTAPVVFDARQWRRASRAARGRVTAPGAFPLATGSGQIVMGATIRAVGHRWRPVTSVPYQVMGRHQVVIESSGRRAAARRT